MWKAIGSLASSPNAATSSPVSSSSIVRGEVVRKAAIRSGGTSVDMMPSRWGQVPPIIFSSM